MVVNIKRIWAAVPLIRIPGTKYYYVTNTIDLVRFNCFWPKPLEAEGDIETDDENARPQQYHSNRKASVVDMNEENEAKEGEDDNGEDNDEQ